MCIIELGSGEDMRKMLFKKILSILDAIELQGVSLNSGFDRLSE